MSSSKNNNNPTQFDLQIRSLLDGLQVALHKMGCEAVVINIGYIDPAPKKYLKCNCTIGASNPNDLRDTIFMMNHYLTSEYYEWENSKEEEKKQGTRQRILKSKIVVPQRKSTDRNILSEVSTFPALTILDMEPENSKITPEQSRIMSQEIIKSRGHNKRVMAQEIVARNAKNAKVKSTLPEVVPSTAMTLKEKKKQILLGHRASFTDILENRCLFASAAEFGDLTNTYIRWCEQQKQFPTIPGLGNFLAFNIQEAPKNWARDGRTDLLEVFEQFKQYQKEMMESSVIGHKVNVPGMIFLMKNHGYADRQETNVKHSGAITMNVVSFLPPND